MMPPVYYSILVNDKTTFLHYALINVEKFVDGFEVDILTMTYGVVVT